LGECFHCIPEVTIYKVPFIKMVLRGRSKVNSERVCGYVGMWVWECVGWVVRDL
jgi:hypothetical protein